MATVEDVRRLMRPHLLGIVAYEAIDPPEEMAKRAGIPPERVVKIDGNENPYGCSPRVAQVLGDYTRYNIYPDPQQRVARQALADYVGVGPEHLVAGTGSDELIDLLLRLFLEPGDGVVDCEPTFGMYRFCTRVCGGRMVPVPRDEKFSLDLEGIERVAREGAAKMIFVTSPNNPTGNIAPREEVQRLVETGLLVVVDETYYEFCGHTVADLVPQYPNLIVLRTLSKWAGLAGLRIGYGIMSPDIVWVLLAMKPPYNITKPAELALLVSLEDRELLLANVRKLVQERERLYTSLAEVGGIFPLASQGNFLLCRVPAERGHQVHQELAQQGVFVRYFDTPRLQDYIRVSVGLPEHTDRLIEALRNVL